MLSRAQAGDIESSGWFRTSSAPYALIDAELRIRGVNAAYEQAVGFPRERMLGARIHDTFPDNPAARGVDALATASQSLETVLRGSSRHCLGLQRYDLPDRYRPGEFTYQMWSIVNTPISDAGRTIAVLHQPQNVTCAVSHPFGSSEAARDRELRELATVLGQEFPAISDAEVLGVVTRSSAVIIQAAGMPDPDRAEALARIRLEVRAGHPARGLRGLNL